MRGERWPAEVARVISAASVRLVGLCACIATLGASLPASAYGAPTVSLRAALNPKNPGHSTTVRLRVQIAPTTELVPPPLIAGELRYPAGLDVQLSGLGIDACSVATLELLGPQSCPPDSFMGYGSATAELPIKQHVFHETAKIAVVRSAEQAGHPALLLYVYGETGLNAQIVLGAQLLPATKPFGGLLDIHVPLVPTFPEGPYVAVSELTLVLNPKGLTYYEQALHGLVPYTPAGIPLPRHCPRGGFAFAVGLSFLGGSRAGATTAVPCPKGSRRRA